MQHLLTFELSKDGDELVVHADERGLRFLSQAILRLAEATFDWEARSHTPDDSRLERK